ncbi:MAG: cold shock domain-containing protein [Bacilli bacterium]|nr:cold shock domain-containing protein [Bacilli bacterium]
MQSRVKWFNNEKGYGFIEYSPTADVFVHYSAIDKKGFKTLNEGDVVDFKLIETPKGLQAQEVSTVETIKAV